LATKNVPPGLVLALDWFWSWMKFFVTGRRWWSLFYRTEQSTQITRTAIYISPHCSVWSPWATYPTC